MKFFDRLFNRGASPGRATVHVSSKSWHGRRYLFWKNRAHFKSNSRYRENLCHYWRVVVLWASFSLFLYWHPRRVSWLRPWVMTAVPSVTGGIVYAASRWPGNVLTVLGFALVALTVVALIAGSVYLIDENQIAIKAWFHRNGPTLSAPFRFAWRNFLGPVYNFFAKKRSWLGDENLGVLLLAATMVPALLVSGGILLWELVGLIIAYPWITLAIVGGILVSSAVIAAAITGILALRDRRRARDPKVVVEKDTTFRSVAYSYVVARKHRICPFIEVDET